MSIKIRFKVNNIEIDYEGSEEFLKEELLEVLKIVAALPVNPTNAAGLILQTPLHAQQSDVKTGTTVHALSTSTIATKISAKSGPDLILAAAAKLTFGDNLESFSRAQLLDAMKLAKAYYKKNYVSNLSKYLQSLVKDGKLVEGAGNTLAISAATAAELKTQVIE